jgi:peptidoglycan hydrolase-like protein with peptidoglycan-binding domain
MPSIEPPNTGKTDSARSLDSVDGAAGGGMRDPRALILQLLRRAERWNAARPDLGAEFTRLTGGTGSTARVVMQWQRDRGLKPDGCLGPSTMAAARQGAGPSPAAAPAAPAAGSDAGQPAQAGAKPQANTDAAPHPLATEAGKAVGLGLGVAVTEGLALVPSWNKPVLDNNGKPVQSEPGVERIGDHDILKRHEEVVGPEITALVDRIPEGALRDFVAGLGEGATAAPGTTYRLESHIQDALHE